MVSFEQAAGGWFEAKVNEMNRKNFGTLRDAMKDGEEITQAFIATRGTEKSGKQGRVDTGAMLDAVDSSATLVNSEEAIGRFGWLGKKPFYAEFQEAGTSTIPAMYALSDAAEIVKNELLDRIGENVRDA